MAANKAINAALREEMYRDDNVYVIGEDVGEFGGIWGATAGLLNEFGKERVICTPMSEMAFGTMAVATALMGKRPVVDMMYANFASIFYESIALEAAQMRFLSGGKKSVPIVFRGAQGISGGGGAFHSQCVESWFLGRPGLIVMCPSTALDAYGMLKTAIRNDNPVLFLENIRLYADRETVPPVEENYTVPVGKARIFREGTDVTVIASQQMLKLSLRVADEMEEQGVSTEVIDPRTIWPYDIDTFCDSARKTGRVIVVHEGYRAGGYGGEYSAAITERCMKALKAPVTRIGGCNTVIPAGLLDAHVVPNEEEVRNAIWQLMKSQ